MVRRAAFTLIELIFAIVIIAISVMSLPMMQQATAKGIDANLVQEAIFAAATQLNEAVAANWDENSIEPTLAGSYARVININGDCDNSTKLKPGQIQQPLHRRCLDDNTTGASDASATAITSLDDMQGTADLFITNTVTQAGYKKKYSASLSVTRGVTIEGVLRNDVKLITVTVEDKEHLGVPLVSLKTYSANIGEVDYYKETY